MVDGKLELTLINRKRRIRKICTGNNYFFRNKKELYSLKMGGIEERLEIRIIYFRVTFTSFCIESKEFFFIFWYHSLLAVL